MPTAPSIITESTYDEVLRSYYRLALDDPRREELRERLVTYLASKAPNILEHDRYEAVIEHLATISSLYVPEEFVPETLAPELAPLADHLVERGSPRGDEGRVLAGLYIRRMLASDSEGRSEADDAYARLQRWGFDARSGLSSPIDRFEGLVEAWEEHARLTPAREVLDQLADLYVSRRQGMVEYLRSESRSAGVHPMALQGLQRTSLDVAAVYLRHADVATALQRVQATTGGGALESQLVQVLRDMRDGGQHGVGATLDLARVYLEGGRSDVALALCRHGLRSHALDPRFAQCLARISATESQYVAATAWYAEAISLAPDERVLYDEALEVLSHLIEQGLFSTDASHTRTLAAHASRILEERVKRWPDSPPPVAPEQLHLALGMAEMNAGNAQNAEERFRTSLAAKENVDALLQLGLLVERTGRPGEAAKLYARALELPAAKASEGRQRAEILERLGDAQRIGERANQAARTYGQALDAWKSMLPKLEGSGLATGHVRRGVMLDRLGRRAEALAAFESAMQAAPGERATYAGILAYLVVAEKPDAAFAERALRRSLRQLSLEPEWKVYFALWVRAIGARAGVAVSPEVLEVFDNVPEGDAWWNRLADFGAGRLDHEGLQEAATEVGQQTEALFYGAIPMLEQREFDQVKALLQRVLGSQMVNFFEHAMAQELMVQDGMLDVQPGEPASTASQPSGGSGQRSVGQAAGQRYRSQR